VFLLAKSGFFNLPLLAVGLDHSNSLSPNLSQEGWEVTGSRYLSFNLAKFLGGWRKLIQDSSQFSLGKPDFLQLRLRHKT
jgi:hypothetical protein